jgi:hypothetical protein
VGAAAVVICLAVTALGLVRLNSQPLRLDEARTALLADAVLRSGVPRMPREGPALFGPMEMSPNGLCVLHTPLQFYVGAIGRRLGRSAGAIRLPFALIGIGSVWGAAALGDHLMPGSGPYVALCFLQVPGLLLIRQARYYPLVFAARVFAMWSLVLGSWWIAALAGIVIASAEWTGYLATLTASFVAALLGSWPMTEALGLLSGLLVVAVWLWLRRDVDQPVPFHPHLIDGFLSTFWTYLWKMQGCLVPLLPVAVVATILRPAVPLPLIAGFCWIVLAHVGMRSVTPAVFTRYLAAAVPPAALVFGMLMAGIARVSVPIAVVLAVLVVATDLLHLGPLLLIPAALARRLAFVRCPAGSYLTRQAPEDLPRRISFPFARFLRELADPPRLRVSALAAALPAGSRVVIGQTEAPTLQVAGPWLDVVPWGIHRAAEQAWLTGHPPDFVVLGDLDRPQTVADRLPWSFRPRVVPGTDVLLANGESLERHVFGDRDLPDGIVVLERWPS